MIMFFSIFFANIDQNKTKDGRKIFGSAKFANLCVVIQNPMLVEQEKRLWKK
jgi:hypothetical protein